MLKLRSIGRPALRDWNDIRFVLAVASTGSFSSAGRETGTHETTVARRVQRLEAELGTKLFIRQSRGILLTAAGEMLVRRAKEIEEAARALQENVAGLDSRLVGTVRITVPEGIGAYWLTPLLPEFANLFPAIRIEVLTDGRKIGLEENDADLALTINRPTFDRLVVFRAGEIHYRLFCSKDYLADRPKPIVEAELATQRLLRLTVYDRDPQLSWWTSHVDRGDVPFATNSANLYVSAVRAGLGIGMMAGFYCQAAPDLVRLDIVPKCSTGLWLASLSESNRRAPIRATIDFLKTKFSRANGVWLA